MKNTSFVHVGARCENNLVRSKFVSNLGFQKWRPYAAQVCSDNGFWTQFCDNLCAHVFVINLLHHAAATVSWMEFVVSLIGVHMLRNCVQTNSFDAVLETCRHMYLNIFCYIVPPCRHTCAADADPFDTIPIQIETPPALCHCESRVDQVKSCSGHVCF